MSEPVRALSKAENLTLSDLAAKVKVSFTYISILPESIRRRVMERPDAFRKIARLTDRALDQLLEVTDEA